VTRHVRNPARVAPSEIDALAPESLDVESIRLAALPPAESIRVAPSKPSSRSTSRRSALTSTIHKGESREGPYSCLEHLPDREHGVRAGASAGRSTAATRGDAASRGGTTDARARTGPGPGAAPRREGQRSTSKSTSRSPTSVAARPRSSAA